MSVELKVTLSAGAATSTRVRTYSTEDGEAMTPSQIIAAVAAGMIAEEERDGVPLPLPFAFSAEISEVSS